MGEYTLALSAAEIARYRGMADRARTDEAAQWTLAGVAPGARIADVGCGPGAITVQLAWAVEPGGSVDAVDGDPVAVGLARELLTQEGIANTAVTTAQADATGLAPASYDVVMLRHVLAHNGGREAAIVAHLASLARPGGCVYLVDVDVTGFRQYPPVPGLEDMSERYAAFHALRGNDPSVGLRLRDLLVDAGLEVLAYRGWFVIMHAPPGVRPPPWAAREAMMAAGVVGPDDIDRWDRALNAHQGAPERSTLFTPMFLAIGRRS